MAALGFVDIFRYFAWAAITFPISAILKNAICLPSENFGQVLADLVRLLGGIFVVLNLLSRVSFSKFLSCPSELADEIQKGVLPFASLSFMLAIFQCSCEFLVQERRHIAFLMLHGSQCALHVFFLSVFLFVFRWPAWSVSISHCLSFGLPGSVVFLSALEGKLSLKVDLFVRMPSAYFPEALRSAVPELLIGVAESLGLSVFYRLFSRSAPLDLLAVLPVGLALHRAIRELSFPFSDAFVATGAGAWSHHHHRRVLSLLFWTVLFGIAPQLILAPVMTTRPSFLAAPFLRRPELCDRWMRGLSFGNLLLPLCEAGVGVLAVIQQENRWVLARVSRGVALAVAALTIFIAGNGESADLLLAVPAVDFALFVGVSVIVQPALQRLWAARDLE
jgi:hypothetical protein